jgi:3-hydroxyisobutyrate dehydrogenase-like beta-hydroxyacid dehydrogenase
MSSIKKVGFVGLGQMGKRMALNVLKAGFDLTVFDIREEAMNVLADQGAKRARSPANLARHVDRIILSLPDAKVVGRRYVSN